MRLVPAMSGKPFDPALRGFHAVYRAGEDNRCPGCGRQHWLVGRVTAECSFCSTALPLEAGMRSQATAPTITSRGKPIERQHLPSFERPRAVGRDRTYP